MKSSFAIVSVILAATIVTAFPPSRNNIERLFGNFGQQNKLRVDLSAYSSLPGPITTTDLSKQNGATWGLARISHRAKLTFSTFSKYIYDSYAGDGVNIYVIDTGVNVDHTELEGRATWGKTIISDSDDTDTIGTGSHFAGITASAKYGVAKKANIIAVKAIGLSNPNVTDLINGVEWAVADHQSKIQLMADPNFKGSVIMLNVGSLLYDPDLKASVDAAYDTGIHVALSAGNDNSDACDFGAGQSKGLTVGASTLSDERAYFSNYGQCVDLFAPGLNCLSTYIGSPSAVATLTGTEQAAAHVAGLLAYFVSLAPQGQASPDIIKKKVLDLATEGLLSGVPDDTINVSLTLHPNISRLTGVASWWPLTTLLPHTAEISAVKSTQTPFFGESRPHI